MGETKQKHNREKRLKAGAMKKKRATKPVNFFLFINNLKYG